MAKRGRKKKIEHDPALQDRLVEYIGKGLTDAMAYAQAGISADTFYTYIREIPEFAEAITRARQQAHVLAVIALRSSLLPQQSTDEETETFSETRVNARGEPYQYTKVVTRRRVSHQPADWRAAVEWLKRRDRDNWSDKQVLQVEDWRTEIIDLLKQGVLLPEQVTQELGGELAQELFNAAGLRVVVGNESGKT